MAGPIVTAAAVQLEMQIHKCFLPPRMHITRVLSCFTPARAFITNVNSIFRINLRLQPTLSMLHQVFVLLSATALSLAQIDAFSHVDNLIGTKNGGNVFAGATRPHGMVKAVADVNGQNHGGFSTDNSPVIGKVVFRTELESSTNTATGFSSLHDMGTGGNPSLGNFPIFPELCPADDINNCVYSRTGRMIWYDNTSVIAQPGYFALTLINGIRAEMTVSDRAAIHAFNFPNSKTTKSATYTNDSLGPHAVDSVQNIAPLILLELDDLSASRQNASISIDPVTGRMTGNGTFLPSFGSGSYMAYFCADFKSNTTMRDNGIHVNNRAGTEPKELFVTRGINAFYIQAGG